MPLGPADLVADGWWGGGGDDGFGRFGWRSGSCRLQCPVDSGGGGGSCLQDSCLLTCLLLGLKWVGVGTRCDLGFMA